MLRNAPHAAEVYRKVTGVKDGIATVTEEHLCRVPGQLAGLEPRELTEFAAAFPGAIASFRCDHYWSQVTSGDLLVVSEPRHESLKGRWNISAVRWSPACLRLILAR